MSYIQTILRRQKGRTLSQPCQFLAIVINKVNDIIVINIVMIIIDICMFNNNIPKFDIFNKLSYTLCFHIYTHTRTHDNSSSRSSSRNGTSCFIFTFISSSYSHSTFNQQPPSSRPRPRPRPRPREVYHSHIDTRLDVDVDMDHHLQQPHHQLHQLQPLQ